MGLVKRSDSTLSKNLQEAAASPPLAPKDAEALLSDLHDASSTVRRRAATALAHHPDCLAAMVGHLMRESDLGVRNSLFSALMHTPSPETARLLVGLLRSEDANLRNEAIEALASMPDAVEPLMQSMMQDADVDVRIFAVNILASIQHHKVVDWLIEIVSNDEQTNVCATAVDLMAEVGDERCLPALEMALKRFPAEPYIEFVVELAQARITNHVSEFRDFV